MAKRNGLSTGFRDNTNVSGIVRRKKNQTEAIFLSKLDRFVHIHSFRDEKLRSKEEHVR